jgi:hypothetical protein
MIRLLKNVLRFASAHQQIPPSDQHFQLFRCPIARQHKPKTVVPKTPNRQIARNSLIGRSFYFETLEVGLGSRRR